MQVHGSRSKPQQRLDQYQHSRKSDDAGVTRIKRRTRRIRSVCIEETIIEEEWLRESHPT